MKGKFITKSFILLAIFCGYVANMHGQAASAQGEFDLGVQAYKGAQYEEALQHFEHSILIDPQNIAPHLYLAATLTQLYVPGVETPNNIQIGQNAIEQYKDVIKLDPKSQDATNGIAYLYLQMKKFDQAKEYYGKAIELDPNNAEPYYSIGVIDWTQSYTSRMELRTKLELEPTAPLINLTECWQLRNVASAQIEDGMEKLTKTISLRPDYDDAMAYMNLLFRERGDIQCGDQGAYDADEKTADKWVDVAMATKKEKLEKSRRTSESGSPPR